MPRQSLLLIICILSACSSAPSHIAISQELDDGAVSQSFAVSESGLWRATLSVIDVYSITVANRERGILQTDWVEQKSLPEAFLALADRHHQRLPASITTTPAAAGQWAQDKSRLVFQVSVLPDAAGKKQSQLSIRKELMSYNKLNGRYEARISDDQEERAILKNVAWLTSNFVETECGEGLQFLAPGEKCPVREEVKK